MLKKFGRPRVIILTLLILICLAVGGASWLGYRLFVTPSDAPYLRRTVRILPIPAARVGSRFVLYREYLAHLDAAERFLSGPAARAQGLPATVTADIRLRVLDQTLRIAAVEELSRAAGLVVTPLDVDRTYEDLVARAGTSTTPEEIRQFLDVQFGWDEASFKRYVVRPALLEDALRQKKARETQDPQAFDRDLETRLSKPDVVRYVR